VRPAFCKRPAPPLPCTQHARGCTGCRVSDRTGTCSLQCIALATAILFCRACAHPCSAVIGRARFVAAAAVHRVRTSSPPLPAGNEGIRLIRSAALAQSHAPSSICSVSFAELANLCARAGAGSADALKCLRWDCAGGGITHEKGSCKHVESISWARDNFAMPITCFCRKRHHSKKRVGAQSM